VNVVSPHQIGELIRGANEDRRAEGRDASGQFRLASGEAAIAERQQRDHIDPGSSFAPDQPPERARGGHLPAFIRPDAAMSALWSGAMASIALRGSSIRAFLIDDAAAQALRLHLWRCRRSLFAAPIGS
jgi:hypothetical protein